MYALLAALVNAGLIEERAYAAHRKNILADANLALKRYNPSMKPSDGQFDHLERTARELAENIKENLDGLATNNFYKGSRNLKNIDASARHPLVNYAFILSPAYKSEPAVRDFFTRISKLRSQAIAMPVTINLLKQNVVINDTLIPYYSKNKFTRVYFYSELEKEQLSDRFDKRYLSQQSLIESVLTSQSQLFAYYNQQSDRKTGKDSLVLVKQMAARNKYQEGTLYIYRNARSAENRWSVVFVEGDREAVNPRIEVIAQSWQINRGKTEQENIDDLLSGFYLSYRKRSMQNQLNYE